jgi:hypothetical protein
MERKLSASNGLPPWLLPMKRPAGWSERARAALTRLLNLPPPVRLACVLMLLVLVTLCAGCATSSPASAPAVNPAPPKLSEPLPSASYSDSARKLIETWRNALTDM